MTLYDKVVAEVLKLDPKADLEAFYYLKKGYTVKGRIMSAIERCQPLFSNFSAEKSFEIPKTVQAVCAQNAILRIANMEGLTSVVAENDAEAEKIKRAQQFVDRFQKDLWLMSVGVWQEVWGNLYKDAEIEYFSQPESLIGRCFLMDGYAQLNVIYQLHQQIELNLFVYIDWQTYKLHIGAETLEEGKGAFAILPQETENVLLKTDSEEGTSKNISRYGVSLNENSEITADMVHKLKIAAEEISSYSKNFSNFAL